MENNEDLDNLFKRYLDGTCSPDEVRFLLHQFTIGENEDQLQQVIRHYLDCYAYEEAGEAQLKSLADRALINIRKNISYGQQKKAATIVPFFRRTLIKAAAAAAILLTGGMWFYFSDNNEKPTAHFEIKPRAASQAIVPGGEKAVLTLSDGTIIILDSAANGELAKQGNTLVIKMKDGQLAYNAAGKQPGQAVLYNTMTTPRGGQYKLTLPDGTRVWLNAASSIRYPTVFSGDERRVDISGEVYFEVAHNKSMPFKVSTNEIELMVLGTHFNINAYEDEGRTATTLLEGSVKINFLKGSSSPSVILKRGEQAQLVNGGTTSIEVKNDVDTDEIMAWKNGAFIFNGSDIKSVMRQISRWYDVDVFYEGRPSSETFSGIVSRNSNISQVIKIMQEGGVDFKIEGEKIIVIQK